MSDATSRNSRKRFAARGNRDFLRSDLSGPPNRPQSDPYGGHDSGAFKVQDQALFFKIDYFDLTLSSHPPDANNQRSVPSNEWQIKELPADPCRVVREYLDRLDDAALGGASPVVPKFMSPSDPASQWTSAMRGPAFFAYADNYLIDGENAVIVDVEATRAIRQAEVGLPAPCSTD